MFKIQKEAKTSSNTTPIKSPFSDLKNMHVQKVTAAENSGTPQKEILMREDGRCTFSATKQK